MATDEIKARPRSHRRTRAVRPAQVLPELVEDDFDSTAPQQRKSWSRRSFRGARFTGLTQLKLLYPAAVKTARRLEHQG